MANCYSWCPDSQAADCAIGRLVILALDHVLRTAVKETEDRVVHVFPESHRRESFAEVVTRLSVDLRMRVEVVIAVRAQ